MQHACTLGVIHKGFLHKFGTFWDPRPPVQTCPHLLDPLLLPLPLFVQTLALFETLQLVNNSHWRVKKTDHSDTGCTHVCSYYTTSIIAFQKMGLQVFQNHYLEKEKILFTWVNFTNMVDIIFFQADVHIWVTNPSPCSHLSTFAWSPSPQCADILYGWPPR